MSTHKNFDKICCVVLALVILITVLFVNGEKLGIKSSVKAMGYEDRLFDTSRVHTLDIVIDDWDSFLETCTNEEYTACGVVIDGEAFRNVALRAKGNTSLTNVKNYGNNRYSLKIEFDAYDDSNTYYGLDKLCLNNIIQDNTYMKDYVTYMMMGEFGTASPLCSYVYITVNGEDWGLFLAVEGVEDSFLQRNYGSEDGDLYKPDSQSMGGGRGNGRDFNMDDFNKSPEENKTEEKTEAKTENQTQTAKLTASMTAFTPDGNGAPQGGMPQGGMEPPGSFGGGINGERPELPNGEMPQMPDGEQNGNPPELSEDESPQTPENGENSTDGNTPQQNNPTPPDENGGMGSDDVKLIYTDDSFDSYSNIFNNAKTTVTDKDKKRLIASLKNIGENTDIEKSVDVESVIRYFVVHNFVLNFDSYTGSMIHNYYLYESGGQLSMIPWDYNLAFGGFQSMGGAQSLVNYPIDSPASGGTTDSRPMLSWILNSEEYTEKYHSLFAEFLKEFFDGGQLSKEIKRVKEMISPYVEKDPTKFCTYEEFQKGADTLSEFCELRAESISFQLDGTIGSTSETQTDKTNFVKAENITVSDMGSMGNMGGGPDDRNNTDEKAAEISDRQGNIPPDKPDSDDGKTQPEMPSPDGENFQQNGGNMTQTAIIAAASAAILIFGIIFALIFKRKKI